MVVIFHLSTNLPELPSIPQQLLITFSLINIFNTNLKTGVIKTDVSDHFPIFFIDSDNDITSYPQETIFKKRIITDTKINNFRTRLSNINWSDVLKLKNPNDSYNLFIKIFSKLYVEFFPLKTIKIKKKSLLSPWMSRGLLKSSKQKQRLYNKFLKHRTYTNETNYKTYKNLFEKIKKVSKKVHYSKLLNMYQSNAKKTWQIIKEVIGKTKLQHSTFPKMMLINNIENFDKTSIANNFNKYFTEIGPNLANKIDPSIKSYERYLTRSNTIINNTNLNDEEFINL